MITLLGYCGIALLAYVIVLLAVIDPIRNSKEQ